MVNKGSLFRWLNSARCILFSRGSSGWTEEEPAGETYLDVLDAFFDLFGSEVVVGHQLVALFDGLLQVGRSPTHLVFEGLVLTQQAQRPRQVLPMILGGQDLLLLPDPALLQKHRHTFRSPQVDFAVGSSSS